MDRTWRPIALGRLRELLNRIDESTIKEDILSAVDNLAIPEKCKENILRQLISRGIVTTPAPAAWTQFDPGKAINFAIEEIRIYDEEV